MASFSQVRSISFASNKKNRELKGKIGSVVATEEMHLQVQHARQLVKSHFPDRSLSCEKMFKRSKAIQGLVPQSCVVYGGLYGVGFKLVRELCLSGSQRVIILSPLPLSMLSKERFDLLQG